MQYVTYADRSRPALRFNKKTTLGILGAVGFVLCSGAPALAQNSCGAAIEPTIQTAPDMGFSYFIGTTLTVNVELGTGTIQGGDLLSIPSMQYSLECLTTPFLDCGAAAATSVTYLGDATLITDCNVDIVSDSPSGGTTPNSINFSFSPEIELPEGASCNVSFMVQIIDTPPMDFTPNFIEESASFMGTCDNDLVGQAFGSLAIPVVFCGDNAINVPGETCDGADSDDCVADCRMRGTPAECTCCGDGIVQTEAGEECDPADPDAPPNCGEDCILDVCGDDMINQPDETCDGSDATGCLENCRPPGDDNECTCCGDGIVQDVEECDPADPMAPPNCADDCTLLPICGDDVVNQPDETCDGNDAPNCLEDCRLPGTPAECTCCGDGIVQTEAGEECDPADPDAPPNCGEDCILDVCGDDMINQPDETCDGGDATGCLLDCRPPGDDNECTCCGDGIVQDVEECDPADPMGPPNCADDCTLLPICGDDMINQPEENCDGSDLGGTACTDCRGPDSADPCTCCGDGVEQPDSGEQCDLGNLNGVPGSGCASDCTIPDVEACCLETGECIVTDVEDCALQGGTPLGAGSVCAGITEGCCFPDNTCEDLDIVCCELLGGTPQGSGSSCTEEQGCCLPDGTCSNMDPLCCLEEGGTPGDLCTDLEGCCFPDNTCTNLDPACCIDQGGTPQGAGESCTQVQGCCLDDGTCSNMDPLCCLEEGGTPGDLCTDLEGCCFPDNTCQNLDPACCIDQGGTPQGDGESCTQVQGCCLPDGTCSDMDPLCCLEEGGTPGDLCTDLEGCCFPDNTCQNLDPACCIDQGGTPQGDGESCTQVQGCCLPDGTCSDMDPLCCLEEGGTPGDLCTDLEGCCFPDNTCQNLDPACCIDQGGTPQGDGESCTEVQGCCLPDGTCSNMDPLCCLEEGGTPGDLCTDLEGCCFPDNTCMNLDPTCCIDQGGTPQGDGESCTQVQGCCLPDGTCSNMDPLCCLEEGGTPGDLCTELEGCCFPDNTCQNLDPACCIDQGGTPQGDGESCTEVQGCCLPDGTCSNMDPLCCLEEDGTPGDLCTDLEGCCFPDNTCQNLDPTCCIDQGGTPQGAGESCTQVQGCCLDDGTCSNMDPLCCLEEGGTPGDLCTDLEGCCFPDNTCMNLDPACCTDQGGTPQGDGESCTEVQGCCLPDGTCSNMDPLCCLEEGGTPGDLCTDLEGCCLPDNTCENLDVTCCELAGGTPQGAGNLCTAVEACCLPDDTCEDMDPLCCLEENGEPQGPGSDCDDTVCEDCTLEVTKTCVVEQPVSGDYVCDKPIETLTMIWDGSEPVRIVAWKGGVGSTQLADIDGIAIGDEVSVSGYTGSPNDVFWQVYEAGPGGNLIGESKFHLSCSDNDMNGAEDCGKRQGNGKSNDDDSLVNDWLLEGIVDEGGVLDCTPDDPGVGEPLCEIPPLMPGDQCEGGVEFITFRYIGGDCGQTTNFQEGALECSGDAGMTQPVAVVITADVDDADVTPSAQVIGLDDTFTISATGDKLKSNTEFDIVQDGDAVQSIKFHTSCSKPLNVGDIFGAVEVVAFKSKDGGLVQLGSNVTYYYVIENTGPIAITDVTVEDSVLGTVDGSPILLIPPGETVTLSQEVFVDAPVTNTVEVVGQSASGPCEDEATATVSIAEPPPCTVVGDCKLKLEDDKIKWKLFNVGDQDAIIESIEITWPVANDELKKIKLDGDIYTGPKLAPPSAVIDTFTGDISKRTIEAGKDETLEIEFEEKKKPQFQDDYMITVNFVQGCSVTFVPNECPYVECDKPIEALSMIWDGAEPVRIVAWKGPVGSEQLTDIDDIAVGDEITVGGYTGSPNDVFWEVFEAGPGGDFIGLSKFHLSCSDRDMNGPEDCGKRQGNGKSNDDDSLVNDWLLEGILDAGGTLDCSDL